MAHGKSWVISNSPIPTDKLHLLKFAITVDDYPYVTGCMVANNVVWVRGMIL